MSFMGITASIVETQLSNGKQCLTSLLPKHDVQSLSYNLPPVCSTASSNSVPQHAHLPNLKPGFHPWEATLLLLVLHPGSMLLR